MFTLLMVYLAVYPQEYLNMKLAVCIHVQSQSHYL